MRLLQCVLRRAHGCWPPAAGSRGTIASKVAPKAWLNCSGCVRGSRLGNSTACRMWSFKNAHRWWHSPRSVGPCHLQSSLFTPCQLRQSHDCATASTDSQIYPDLRFSSFSVAHMSISISACRNDKSRRSTRGFSTPCSSHHHSQHVRWRLPCGMARRPERMGRDGCQPAWHHPASAPGGGHATSRPASTLRCACAGSSMSGTTGHGQQQVVRTRACEAFAVPDCARRGCQSTIADSRTRTRACLM